MRSAQCITKAGGTILLLAGRFSQIWKSFSGFGLSECSSGNISPCTMPYICSGSHILTSTRLYTIPEEQPHVEPGKQTRSERSSGRGVEQNRAGSHPLKVAVAVAACIAHAVCVIHATFERGSERLEPSVRMLRKTWHAVAVVHAVWLTCAQSIRAWSRHHCKGVAASRTDTHLAPVKVSTVAAPRGLHLGVASRVLIVVIHAEQERVLRLEGEAKAVHRADGVA